MSQSVPTSLRRMMARELAAANVPEMKAQELARQLANAAAALADPRTAETETEADELDSANHGAGGGRLIIPGTAEPKFAWLSGKAQASLGSEAGSKLLF